MRIIGKDTEKGVFLPEVMIASTIMLFAVIVLVTFYMTAQVTWMEENTQLKLQQNARVAMDFMVRGKFGTGGIMEAKKGGVTLSGSSTIHYKSGFDGLLRSFYQSGDELIHSSRKGSWEKVIDKVRITPAGLTFAVSGGGDIVTVNLSLEDQVRSRTFNVDLSTDVLLRNKK